MRTTITREYLFREDFLKDKLKMEGNIINLDLWEGLAPIEEEQKVKHGKVVWRIVTEEKK